jgi:lipopolysaccharide/colanic/teichoic acid biosynthesis glycosyltransferase
MITHSSPIQEGISFNQRYLRTKRLFDVLFTVLIIPFFFLLVVVVAVLIRLDSEGPIFYRQKRVGQDGEEFEMFKFRSMYVQNDESLHREAVLRYIGGSALNAHGAPGTLYKLVDDPRVTRVGRFLRKTSIDEFPQFLNVLRGDMSLVGPRPPVPYEVEQYSPHDRLRMSGKPGLTGTWQVYGRSRVPFPQMVEMDIAYLQKQSILEDLKLIALTVPVIIAGRGGA